MSWLALSFGQPLVLFGLAALPVIWWLLRATPPRPQDEIFPPLRILSRVLKREETPERSPWWLTLLRLLMAALVILALADPVVNPREKLPAKASALAVVSLAPSIALGVLAQRHLVRGLTLGAVRG